MPATAGWSTVRHLFTLGAPPMTEDECWDATIAVWEGRAVDVWPCEHLTCNPTGRWQNAPLRGVIATRRLGGPDPTDALVLTCGHYVL